MEHSRMYEKIKRWYPRIWKLKAVQNAVVQGWITAEEFEEITSEKYDEKG